MPDRAPKPYAKHPHACDAHGMAFGHYYVAEVSFRPSNPVHRYIAYEARGGGSVRLAGGGLEREDEYVWLDQLAFFRVVEEVTAMRDAPSRFMPDDPERSGAGGPVP